MQRFTSQKEMKILTFSTRRQNSLNGVLDETTTANTRGRSSREHARLCKFTSGSRPSSSRRLILRSLLCIPTRAKWWKSGSVGFLLPYPPPRPPRTRGAWKALARLYKFLCRLLHFILLLLQNLGRTL